MKCLGAIIETLEIYSRGINDNGAQAKAILKLIRDEVGDTKPAKAITDLKGYEQEMEIELGIVAALEKMGVQASVEYPGYVCVTFRNGDTYNFGRNNDNWGGDARDKDGYETNCDSGCCEFKQHPSATATDAQAIALDIYDALDKYQDERGSHWEAA